MNKHILKILIILLILLIGIGAVNALDYNSTEEITSFEQNEKISISDNSSEVLNIENNDNEIITLNNNSTEILSIKNNDNEIITLNNNSTEILSIKNNDNEVLSVNNNETELSSSVGIFYEDGGKIKVTEESKTFYIGKMTVPYNKKYETGHIPSKKNKKAWKKYKNYLKSQKKALKKFKKQAKKRLKKIEKTMKKWHWKYPSVSYNIKKYAHKWIITYYYNCLRHYHYNTVTKTGWWG